MDQWLTINDLAHKTGIPDTTIRRYIAKFSQFFVEKGGARAKLYESRAAVVLLKIKDCYDKGLQTGEVYDTLLRDFPLVVDANTPVTAPNRPELATLQDIEDIKEALRAQQEFNRVLLERLSQQEAQLEKRDKALLEGFNRTYKQAQEERQLLIDTIKAQDLPPDKLPFWKRLFR